jgi:class 3 adenylate cyclase
MSQIKVANLDHPDEVREFPGELMQMSRLGSQTIGRAVLAPGWRWTTNVGPRAGTTWCRVHHFNYVISGRLAFATESGETVEIGPGEVADVPPGHDAWVVGDEAVVVLDFFGNIFDIGLPMDQPRVLATILMSDVVDSTATANRLGDSAWRELLADHNRIIRRQLERFGGREVKTTGDGFIATFPSAASALRCAAEIVAGVKTLGIEVRVGVHTGEIEDLTDDVRGIAVHATARIMSLAGPSEVLASSVTKALVDGSGLRFEDRGAHEIKGFDETAEVFALVS